MISNNVNKISVINGKNFTVYESIGIQNKFFFERSILQNYGTIKSIAVSLHQFYLKENTKNA